MDKARILIVEDEKLVAMSLEERLRTLGHEVIGNVTSGEAGIERCESGRPDLVLMDVRLAGTLDGVETASIIRHRFGIPSVFLTAYADDATLARAKISEPFGYIVKPFDGRLLAVTIEVALYRQRLEEDRARAREELRDSEARYRDLARYAPVGIFQTDAAGRYRYTNPRWCDIAGLSPDEALGDGWLRAVHREDREVVSLEWEKASGSQSILHLEFRFERPDGSVTQVFAQAHPERSGAGDVLGYVGTITDLTELRATQDRLRESEMRLRDVTRTMPAVVHQVRQRTDGTFSLQYVTGAVELLAGSSQKELEARAPEPFALVHEDDVEGLRRAVTRAAGRREILDYEFRVRNPKTGELRWVREIATPVLLDNGEILWNGLVVDITRGREAERALREEEEARRRTEARYAAILDHSPDAIVCADGAGSIVVFNKSAERIFGYEASEVIGNPLDLLVPVDRIAAHRGHVQKFALGEVRSRPMSDRPPIEGRRKDGRRFPAEAVVGKMEHRGETLLTAIVRDVSDRKKLEEQYLHAQKMDALGRLAGGVAHDFNNVLSGIMGHTELLKMSLSKQDPLKEELDEVLKECEHAAALTRQLLIFSRQEILEPSVVDVGRVISGMERMLRRIIGEDIDLAVSPIPEGETVRIDPGQLEQVILNLVLNARDAMPRGGTVGIDVRREELTSEQALSLGSLRPGSYVVIEVADTGCGMDAEVLSRIFEPFFTTKEKGKGTGLGLSTVFGIVGKTMGHVLARSSPGMGSRLTLYLPHAGSEASRSDDPRNGELPRGTETILLVEDDETVSRPIGALLEWSGYDVVRARNGEEALRIAERYGAPIHMLLSDIIMPHMNGYELAERLQRALPSLKALFMSGYVGDSRLGEILSRRTGLLLKKPFTALELTSRVRQVLDSADGESAERLTSSRSGS